MLVTALDTTIQVIAEPRQAFLLQLELKLRSLSGPSQIHAAASEALGRALNANQTAYADMDELVQVGTIAHGWNGGAMPSNVGDVLGEAGCTAIEAADSAAGLKVLESSARIDLLVTDVGLPGGMNGRQVADAGRVLRPRLKVLFITGYAENAVVGNSHLEAGMAMLTKPFAMAALGVKIREMVEGKAS